MNDLAVEDVTARGGLFVHSSSSSMTQTTDMNEADGYLPYVGSFPENLLEWFESLREKCYLRMDNDPPIKVGKKS